MQGKRERRDGKESFRILLSAVEGKEREIFDDEGKPQKPKSQIWRDIWEQLPNDDLKEHFTPKYIYQWFIDDRHQIATTVSAKCGVDYLNKKSEKRHLGESLEQDEDKIFGSTQETKVTNLPKENFLIQIPKDTWEEIKPQEKVYKRNDRSSGVRRCLVLPPFLWTGKLADLIWKQHQLPCAYAFKRANVNQSVDILKKYVVIDDLECHECGATGSAFIDAAPDKGMPALLHLRAPNTQGVLHKRKRVCFRPERVEIGKEVAHQSVSEYRRQVATSKVAGHTSAPNFYKAEVLRKIKQEHRAEMYASLEIPLGDPVASLLTMKRQGRYVGSIHLVAADPVVVSYSSPTQMQLNNTICANGYSRQTVDATGGCASRIERLDGLSCNLLLYQVTGENSEGTVPLNQMISERQDAALITFWLHDAVRKGYTIPDEVVCDDSKALLCALSRAMGLCGSSMEYKEICFQYLSGKSKKLPRCFIRNDLAHFLKNAQNWKIWKTGTSPLVKTHLIRWLGLLIKCRSFEEFQQILEELLTVSAAETAGNDSNLNPTPAAIIKKRLNGMVAGTEMPAQVMAEPAEEDANVPHEEDADDPHEDEDDSPESIKEWRDAVRERALRKAGVQGDDANAYHHRLFFEKVCKIAIDFVFWSAVMVDPFKSPYPTGVSAHVEGYFAVVKGHTFKDEVLPIDVNKFVGIHLSSIMGHVAMSSIPSTDTSQHKEQSPMSEENPSQTDQTKSNSSDEEDGSQGKTGTSDKNNKAELDSRENWRGVGDKKKEEKPSKSKYLQNHPEIEIESLDILNPPKNYFLRNGVYTGFHSIAEHSKVQVTNTCAFDSMAQILMIAVIEYPLFRRHVQQNMAESAALKLVWELAHVGAGKETYATRCKALVVPDVSKLSTVNTVPSTRSTSHRKSCIMAYDCWGNLYTIMSNINLRTSSVTIEWTCGSGHKSMTEQLILAANSKVMKREGIAALQDAIIFHMGTEDKECHVPECKKTAIGDVSPGEVLFVDTGFFGAYKKQFQLQDIPINITLGTAGQRYFLFGVVAHKPQHYVGYARRLRGTWEEFDDCKRHPYTVKGTEKITPEMLFYIRK